MSDKYTGVTITIYIISHSELGDRVIHVMYRPAQSSPDIMNMLTQRSLVVVASVEEVLAVISDAIFSSPLCMPLILWYF